MSGNLERRYRRVLRLLPRYYREQWEEDMVAAFLDSWLTGDPEADEYITMAAGPSEAEVASVAALAARLYLGGAGTPRRYFAWGQAVRCAVLAVMLVQAVRGLAALVFLARSRRLTGWLPTPHYLPLNTDPPYGVWSAEWYLVTCAWIVVFVALVLGHYRTARVIAAAAIVPDLVALLQPRLTGTMLLPVGWPWVLFELAPVLAMAAFHRDAPPAARWPWLLALPAGYYLAALPVLALQATGNSDWLPDFSGQCCILVALACLAHAPRALSRQADGSGVWSLTLTLLAATAGAYQIALLLTYYLHYPAPVKASLAELLILAAAVALVAPDAARTQAAEPAPPPYPHPG